MSSWLAEDPELLQATLAFLDHWGDGAVESLPADATDQATGRTDSSDDSSRSNCSNSETRAVPSTSSEETVSAEAEFTPSTLASTHHRRRLEIKHLRETVARMESQLQELANRQTELFDERAVALMWRDLAARQRQLRQKAELDQTKLRNLLKTQVKVTRGLVRHLEKARSIESDELVHSMGRPRVMPAPDVRPPEQVQFSVVDQLYAHIADLFTFSKFRDGSTDFADVQVVSGSNGDMLIQVRESWVLPFDPTQVLDALWAYTIRDYAARCQLPGNKPSSKMTHEGNGLVNCFSVRAPVGTTEFHHDGQVVARRFGGERGRPTAIVSSMQAGPNLESTVPRSGVHVIQNSCTRIQAEFPSDEQPTVTRVEFSQQLHVSFDSDNCPGRQQEGVFTNILLKKINQDTERKHGTVEAFLLQPSHPCFVSVV